MVLLYLFLLLLLLPCVTPERRSQANSLDAILQEYAYRAMVKPKTGTIYNATEIVPKNLSGIRVGALRLRSGSMRRKGVPMYNEFQIPKWVVERPYVKRVVLVYQNLGNWSTTFYPLPNYTYLAPLLGLLAYNGSNLSATNLPTLHVNASAHPIIVKFHFVNSPPPGTVAKCVRFDLQGSSIFTNVTSGNTCSTFTHGHFSIVATLEESKSNNRVWVVILGSVLGLIVFLVLLSLLLLCLLKYKENKNMQAMEMAAEAGEALYMTSVGEAKAPAATLTRTHPTLEHEYVYAPSHTIL
ncbi:hypothetical protein RJT34_22430 [Clitoria ternatea]|uniref:Uncharacterized protein n=1 Tax=Clitoria ternatea TaxID=43366 RepID=A0AAN9IV93_CLITE